MNKKYDIKSDPEAGKDSLLKIYPPKIARKRAGQIVVNKKTDDEKNPEISANVRTIPGIITQRGCCYAGCKGVVLGPTARHREPDPRPHRLRLLQLAHPEEPDKPWSRR